MAKKVNSQDLNSPKFGRSVSQPTVSSKKDKEMDQPTLSVLLDSDLSDSYSGPEDQDSPVHSSPSSKKKMEELCRECDPSPISTRNVKVSLNVQSEEGEEEVSREKDRRVRRISIVDGQTTQDTIIYKQGHVLRQTRTFGRWVKQYCSVEGHKLYMAKKKEDKIREEILLKDATVVENSTQNINNSFTVMTPHQRVILAGDNRKEMEEWLSSIKQAALKAEKSDFLDSVHHLDGQHSWFSCSHPRPTYCNVCGEALHSVGWRGLSCEVCKFKCHRHCVFNVVQNCKWTTRSNIEKDGADILPDLSFPHQWVEGNLPTGSKCTVCKKACGSVKRLQDFRCIWCKWTVHTDCKIFVQPMCSLGSLRYSTLPPSAIQQSNDIIQGMWEPFKTPSHDPVLAFVNSKSGDNKGVRFLRRLKFWLNPLQVFDLAISGPEPGLQLFQRLDKFRVIVFGGDGSIGWVLSTIDKLHLHSKCIVGVVPLGTGNDLARVLGWGAQCSDEERIPTLLSEMECSSYRLLDRWSVRFTTDTSIDISSSFVKTHYRNRSTGSDYSGDSKSPILSPDEETPTKSLGHTQNILPVGSNSDTTLSSSPDPTPIHLNLPIPDSVSVHSSNSSYHSAHSRTPSPESCGTVLFTESLEASETDENAETTNQANIVSKNITGKPVQTNNGISITNDEDNQLTNFSSSLKHLVVVTPPEDLTYKDIQGWVESLQTSIMSHLSTILLSENEGQVIGSAQVLCEVVRQFVTSLQGQKKMALSEDEFTNDPLVQKCSVLDDKLKKLLSTLTDEAASVSHEPTNQNVTSKKKKEFQPRDALMARANSLKKAVQSVIDLTEKVVDEQEETTVEVKTIMQSSVPEESPADELTADHTHQHDQVSPTPSGRASDDSEQIFAPPDLKEICCMNNYFGIGLDAKIAYEFHTRREENPAQFKNRTRNKILYGYLGGKEFFTNTQRYLERKLSLECDGKEIQLPQRLQGLVFLNIPSYMAGTNFWGTEREKEGFSAPSFDDKLLEVVGITGFTHLATTRVLGIQNQRLAQCRSAKVIIHSELMLQVDGEAWSQEPGVILITHRNRAKLIFKDRAFAQSLESWSMKHAQIVGGVTPAPVTTLLRDVLTSDEMKRYKELANAVQPLMECLHLESENNLEVACELLPHVTAANVCLDRVFPTRYNVSETADLEHLQDFESSVKALLQETLWSLNMEKISQEREEEMRRLVAVVEIQIKRAILPQKPVGSQRRASDSLLLQRPPYLGGFPSPVLSSHRERAIPVANSDLVTSSNKIAQEIGKNVTEWSTEEVCQWFEGVGFGEYTDAVILHNLKGEELCTMRIEDMQGLGIMKISHQTRLRQALQVLNSKNLFAERRLTE